jgi:hypothetical protein
MATSSLKRIRCRNSAFPLRISLKRPAFHSLDTNIYWSHILVPKPNKRSINLLQLTLNSFQLTEPYVSRREANRIKNFHSTKSIGTLGGRVDSTIYGIIDA